MNIFGFQIGRDSTNFPIIPDNNINVRIADQGPTIRPELKGISIPEEKRPANIVPVKPNVLTYNTDRSRRGDFIESEYDLAQIGRVEDTDSYVAQAFIKKIGLLFKEGYELVGPDPRTIQYIKMRFEQIARATGIPTDELIRSIGSGLIKKSNAFLIKVRKESASGGRRRQEPGKETLLEPVAGYFVAPPETMEVDADQHGKIRRWKQRTHQGNFKYFQPQDVIHFYFNKKEGLMFGTPTLVPVIDDIRALRKIEENVELLIYQHLFPLFHYKIGTDDQPASVTELGESEIEVAQREIRYMPSEGGIVTSHRHQIQLIGTENRALRAEAYLEHFKKRVFSGLGISAVDMGEGECYDESTQTLTENGWKFHWAIDHQNEKIATYNPVSKRIEFHLANYKYEAPYLGKMIRFKNIFLDMQVTPSHDMWVLCNSDRVWRKMTAQQVADGKAGYRCSVLQTAAFWDDACPVLPHEDTLSLAALAGFVAGRGYENRDGHLYIRKRKFPGLGIVCETLSALGIPWTIEGKGYNESVKIDENTLGGFFKQFLDVSGLKFAEKFPLPARKLFVCNFVRTSFDHRVDSIGKTGNKFVTRFTEQPAVDIVQRLVISAGYSLHVTEDHNTKLGHHFKLRANLREKNDQTRLMIVKRDVSEVDYGGIIYCYNVPNHLFVTRRNNYIAIQGNTANRATSDNMSRNLVDSVKDIQRTIECQINDFIINELLLESTFGPMVLNEEHKVKLKFKEIDLDHQIKKETHYADLFNKNTITFHEARMGMGYQPIRIPTIEEIENDQNLEERYPEWFATRWKLFDEPKTLIQAIDEPYSPAAKAAAASTSTSLTEQQRVQAGEERAQNSEREARASKQNAPTTKTQDFLTPKYNDLESDLVQMVNKNSFDFFFFRQLAMSTKELMIKDLKSRSMASFMSGYRSLNGSVRDQAEASIRSRGKIESRVEFYVNRLINDTVNAVKRQGIADLPNDDKIHRVKAVFDSFKYRNRFMEDVEIRKAFNLGFLEAAKDQDFTKWKIVAPSDACDTCKRASAEPQPLQSNFELEDIPPLHANARAEIEVLKE